MRADLLALSLDDLAALANRGTVKRAQRELDENEIPGALTDPTADAVEVQWADGVVSRIAAGVALADGTCTCGTAGLCRHLVRAVLLYQRLAAPAPATATTPSTADNPNPAASLPTDQSAPVSVPVPVAAHTWDPGQIPDAQLQEHFRKTEWTKIVATFQDGILADLIRSNKPMAHLRQPAAVVRFLVPGDPRYVRCDCAEQAPCRHVPLAVWAFRQLPPASRTGIVATGGTAAPIPAATLATIPLFIQEFLLNGMAAQPAGAAERLNQLTERLRSAGLIWPADILADLAEQQSRYDAHDALFSPDRLPEFLGELLVRHDAMLADTGAIPQALIRGIAADTAAPVGKTRYIGLGTSVSSLRGRLTFTTYLQDDKTGAIATWQKEYRPAEDDARTLSQLGQFSVVKSSSQVTLARGQLLVEGAKRTPGGRLTLARAQAVVQPQSFQWEQLRPPVLVEDHTELAARW
ncbi:MAG: SWIM zinc finger family protein, partial [Gemmataceae bacterium]